MNLSYPQHQKQKGLTLIELMVGIVALGTMMFLALSGYERFQMKQHVQRHVQDLMEITIGIDQSFMMVEGTYASVTPALVLGAYIPPNHMRRGGATYNPWGGTVNFAPATINNPNDAFRVTTTQLPEDACIQLIHRLAPIYRNINVNGVTVRTNGVYLAAASGAVVTMSNACNAAAPATISIVYQ